MELINEIKKALAWTEIMPCLTSIFNLMLFRHVGVEYSSLLESQNREISMCESLSRMGVCLGRRYGV